MINFYTVYIKTLSLVQKNYFYFLFLLLLSFNIFIFRDVLLSSYDSWVGNVFISREELVPIFDINTQFFDQMKAEESVLTSTPEIRVSYSAITSWARYNYILPISIVLFSTVSFFILIFSFFYFCHNVLGSSRESAIQASFFPGISIGFIILYSKIAHFYTLVFGFSLFVLALVLTIDLFLKKREISIKHLGLIMVLVLLNPAIHFHVLYYVTSFIMLFFIILIKKIHYGTLFRQSFKKTYLFLIVTLLSFIPYALFILYITSSLGSKISDSIPIDYWLIYYASLPLQYLLTLNMPGHVDLVTYGNYISSQIKYSGIILMVLSITGVIFINFEKKFKKIKIATNSLFLTFIVSLWMSTGYLSYFSMHSAMASVINYLPNKVPLVANFIESLFFLLLQILRYPHRFEFILFAMVGLLSTIGILKIHSYFDLLKHRIFLKIAFSLLLFIGFISNVDYRNAMLKGDFNSFISPFIVPDELKDIKKTLESLPKGKMIILPSLESGRILYTGIQKISFLDKTLIYYLNVPSFYYGSGSNISNKILSINVYSAILNEEPWWDELLYINLDIQYILIPRTLYRDPGEVYLPGIETKINKMIKKSTVYTKIYSGSTFELYEAKISKSEDLLPTMISVNDMSKVLTEGSSSDIYSQEVFLPFQVGDYIKSVRENNGKGFLVTDRLEDITIDFIGSLSNKKFFPNSKKLPFSKKTTNSSFYLSNTFSFFTMLDEGNPFNHFKDVPASTLNIMNPYFYQISNDAVSFEIIVNEDTNAEIVIRGAGLEGANLLLDNSVVIPMKPVSIDSYDVADYKYYKSESGHYLKKGKHIVTVQKIAEAKNNPIIEYTMLIPVNLELNFTITKILDNKYLFELK